MVRSFLSAIAFCLAAPALSQTLPPGDILAAEEALARQGYDPGPVDGVWDEASAAALRAYQAAWSRPADGVLTPEFAAHLARTHPETRAQWTPAQPRGCEVWNGFPQPAETAAWTGRCFWNRANGPGQLTWRFLGPEGPLEDVYTGRLVRGIKHGEGVHVSANGTRYEGDWRDGEKSGHGVQTWPGGARYEGGWRAGVQHGEGVLTGADGSRYEGGWAGGTMEGHGEYLWADGSRYEGGWRAGLQHGRGVAVLANGARYQGAFRDGVQHGRGAFTWPDGSLYEGDWVAGRRTGKGRLTFADGSVYDGDWVDDAQHGRGIATTPDGGRYEGAWAHGAQHGFGVYTSPSGTSYDGFFHEGLPDGPGTVTRDGVEHIGVWTDGCFIGPDFPVGDGSSGIYILEDPCAMR